MKKKLITILMAAMMLTTFAGCGAKSNKITVISREDGSGTRGAFIELFGIEKKNDAGEKIDHTIDTADLTNSTGVMLTSVAQNDSAIGYVSMGSLNSTVKALEIDGVAANVDNINNGTYKIARPFIIATGESVNAQTQDFIDYILSSEGQSIIEEKGYIKVSDAPSYQGGNVSGKIVVAGSSSVSPVMEKLIEGYGAVNPNVEIDLQTSDSTTGMNSTIQGICDIGMASRELKDSEISQQITGTVIAMDGIAVIVNKKNTVNGLTSDEVMKIYTGEITEWDEVK